MEPRRYLRCLGQPALFSPAGEPIRFRTRKHLALLVYLAVEGRPAQRRDRLAELLWPAVPMAEARHSLATALSVLRPRLGPGALATDRETVTLAPGAVALDLERLLAGDILGSDVTGPLEVAAFLDGFDISESGEFALWKDRQQARLLPAIKGALIVLIDRCRRTGDSRQIEQLADRMLALDELSEEAIRAKMEARAFAGDRLTALQIFEAWKGKLAEELGAVPSDLVEGMAVRLRRRGWERTTLTHIPTVPTDQWRGRPFIGRAVEYRVLYEAWEGMRTGVPGHALVLGDSGIGKTTLVGRLTTAAGLEGAAISRVQCYDLEREIPYATLGNLIHGLLDRPGVSATPPEALAELARTVPEVRRRFPSIPPPEESQGETARIRLTEAFHQMLLAVAEEHPVILVVDDLHLADDASLAVLHLVMRRSRGQPIMVVFIARPGELPRSPQAARLREAVERFGIREIDLPTLTDEECRQLVTTLLCPDKPLPDQSVRRALIRAAAGFPMVLELLVQDWQANGNDSLAIAFEAMTAEFSGRRELHTYRALLARIVALLDPPTQNVLSLAAILGHRLNDLNMYSLLDVSPGQRIAGLSQLASLRVLRDCARGLEFVNELMRAHAYASIPSSLRKTLHSLVADRLLGRQDTEDASGLEIAWHCTRAGRLDEATPHLLRGARQALRTGAPYEAERALSTALGRLTSRERVEATLLLAEVLQEQGSWQESLDRLNELSGEDREASQDEAIVLEAVARVNMSTSSAALGFAMLPELAHIVKHSHSIRTRVRASKAIAWLFERFRDRTIPASLVAQIESIPVHQLDPDSQGELGLVKAMLFYQAGNIDQSREHANDAIKVLRERQSANLVVVQLCSGLGALDSREGAYDSAVRHLGEALLMAQRLGNDTVVSSIIANLAICLGRLGRYEELDDLLGRRSEVQGPELTGFAEIQAGYALSLGLSIRGKKQSAIDAVTAVSRRLTGSVPIWMMQAWMLWKADVLLIAGRRQEAYQSAIEGLTVGSDSVRLWSDAFAGPLARWVGSLSRLNKVTSAESIVEGFVSKLEDYDAMDQAEILCAKRILELQVGGLPEATSSLLRAKLEQLPAAVRAQLVALEVLPYF
jgi:DNA-binding SARP family transcriptional activator/tetratricopeptide (TPR) repeat protein